MNDSELAGRSILGFGELMAALGNLSGGQEAVIRWPNALGARVATAANNPWFDGVVVPVGHRPPPDSILLPSCVWTLE